MPETKTPEAEAPVTPTEETETTAATPETSDAPAAPAAPEKFTIVLPDGRPATVTQQELMHYASKGLDSAVKEYDASQNPKPEPTPESTTEPTPPPAVKEDEDPLERQLNELRKVTAEAQADTKKLREEAQQDRDVAKREKDDAKWQSTLSGLASKHHVDQAGDRIRNLVEVDAMRIFQEATSKGAPKPFPEAYAEAAKGIGDMLAEENRTWVKGKKNAAATAAEAPGGAAPFTPATKVPEGKAEQRAYAAQMDSNEAISEALERFRAMSSQEPVR